MLETVAIIVTKANNLMGGIHDRMPVIVPAKQYADWLARAPLDGGVFAHKKFPRHQWPMPLIIHINFKELEFILILNIFLDNLNLLSHSTMRYFIGMF